MKNIFQLFFIWFNDLLIKFNNKKDIKHQPVFIIGAPRTGSTILYQAITNELDVIYIDNLSCKFNKILFIGQVISYIIFRKKAHNCFTSKYGNTRECNLHAPSECGGFWYRWLPRDRHFIDYDDITDEMVEQIKEEITAVINYFGKSLVFKNLNAGQRLRLLNRCFPDAKFIFVKRNPFFTAQSILKAKRKIGIKDDEFWSIMPKNVKQLEKYNAYEQIVKQIYYLEKQITEDSTLFDKNNFLIINYEELGKSFENVMKECIQFIGVKKKKDYKCVDIKLSEKLLLDKNEEKLLKEQIEKLDWENYSDE